MNFARWTFAIAALWGIVSLIPHYFLESFINQTQPPAITHPEFYYGFVGVALSFQVLFVLIARDPVRLRPAMLAAIIEKLSFILPCVILVASGRARPLLLAPASIDLALCLLFAISYHGTAAAEARA